jgi:hypothetical protein
VEKRNGCKKEGLIKNYIGNSYNLIIVELSSRWNGGKKVIRKTEQLILKIEKNRFQCKLSETKNPRLCACEFKGAFCTKKKHKLLFPLKKTYYILIQMLKTQMRYPANCHGLKFEKFSFQP